MRMEKPAANMRAYFFIIQIPLFCPDHIATLRYCAKRFKKSSRREFQQDTATGVKTGFC
jgi:hypothetical protein